MVQLEALYSSGKTWYNCSKLWSSKLEDGVLTANNYYYYSKEGFKFKNFATFSKWRLHAWKCCNFA